MIEKKKIFTICLYFFLAFAGLSLVLDYVYEHYIIRKNSFSNFNKLERLIKEKHTDEIPVFGSSKARSSFIPDSISSNVYNYAMPRCNFDVIEFLLEIELEKKKNTPMLIEFNHRFFLHNPAHTINVATYIPSIEDARIQKYLKKYDRMEPYYHIPGLRYYGNYMNFINNDLRESLGSEKIFSKGSIISYKRAEPEVFEKFVRGRKDAVKAYQALKIKTQNPKSVISMEEVQKFKGLEKFLLFQDDSARITAFEQLLDKNPHRIFVLVYTPQHTSEMAGIENHAYMLKTLQNLCVKHPNLRFLNYSNMDLKDEEFKDSSHLNSYGANKFCKALKVDLKKDSVLAKYF